MKRLEKYILYILCVMIMASIGTAFYYVYKKDKGLIKPKEVNNQNKKEEEEVVETLEGYTVKNNNGLLCNERDLDCFLKTYLTELSYNTLDNIKEHSDELIKSVLYSYIVHISNQKELFNCVEDACYIDINKELLDTLTYIMFGIEGLDNYNFNIREIEGIFESKNRLYQIKYLPKGGYHHTITDKEIDKVNDNEYNIKLYFEGSSEGGEIQKTESPTFNLKYNEDKKQFYVASVK